MKWFRLAALALFPLVCLHPSTAAAAAKADPSLAAPDPALVRRVRLGSTA